MVCEVGRVTKHVKDRTDQILDFIGEYQAEHGYPPSVREIAVAVGLASTSAVHHHLNALHKAGRITVDYAVARGIRVVRPDGVCPTCGRSEVPA